MNIICYNNNTIIIIVMILYRQRTEDRAEHPHAPIYVVDSSVLSSSLLIHTLLAEIIILRRLHYNIPDSSSTIN